MYNHRFSGLAILIELQIANLQNLAPKTQQSEFWTKNDIWTLHI